MIKFSGKLNGYIQTVGIGFLSKIKITLLSKIISLFICIIFIFSVSTYPAIADQAWCKLKFIKPDTGEIYQMARGMGSLYGADIEKVENLCYDSYVTDTALTHQKDFVLVEIDGETVSDTTNTTNYYSDNTWTRKLNDDELEIYKCLLKKSQELGDFFTTGILKNGADFIISIMPSSPESIRIPTIITNMAGQGTLGANLAIELYSGVWQYFALLSLIKLYKLIPGKST